MITREIRQHEYPDADFGEERENTFFLATGQEVRLRCRYNTTQRRTHVLEEDFLRLPVKQQAQFQANTVNPRCFYCDVAAAVTHAPATRTAKAAKAPAKKLPKRTPTGGRGAGGRGFPWESELGEFIVMELSKLEGYRIKETTCGVKVFGEAAGRFLDRHEVRALRTQLELDRGDEAIRSTSCIKLWVA